MPFEAFGKTFYDSDTMTPAEKLRLTKRRQRPKRNPPAAAETPVLVCRIQAVREALDLSMRDVAAAVGLSLAGYYRIEKGYADVGISNAWRIAKFFGKPITELWELE